MQPSRHGRAGRRTTGARKRRCLSPWLDREHRKETNEVAALRAALRAPQPGSAALRLVRAGWALCRHPPSIGRVRPGEPAGTRRPARTEGPAGRAGAAAPRRWPVGCMQRAMPHPRSRTREAAAPAARHEAVGLGHTEFRAQQPQLAVAGQLGLDLVEHAPDVDLRMNLSLRRAVGIAGADQAFGVEVVRQPGLQGAAHPKLPFAGLGARGAAQRRQQSGAGQAVGQVQADRSRFVRHQVAVAQHRDLAVGVQSQVSGRVVGVAAAIHEIYSERQRQLVQQDLRRQAGIAAEVVRFDRRGGSVVERWVADGASPAAGRGS